MKINENEGLTTTPSIEETKVVKNSLAQHRNSESNKLGQPLSKEEVSLTPPTTNKIIPLAIKIIELEDENQAIIVQYKAKTLTDKKISAIAQVTQVYFCSFT